MPQYLRFEGHEAQLTLDILAEIAGPNQRDEVEREVLGYSLMLIRTSSPAIWTEEGAMC